MRRPLMIADDGGRPADGGRQNVGRGRSNINNDGRSRRQNNNADGRGRGRGRNNADVAGERNTGQRAAGQRQRTGQRAAGQRAAGQRAAGQRAAGRRAADGRRAAGRRSGRLAYDRPPADPPRQFKRPVIPFYDFGAWGYHTDEMMLMMGSSHNIIPGFTNEPPGVEICGEYDLVFAAALDPTCNLMLFRRQVAGTMTIYQSSVAHRIDMMMGTPGILDHDNDDNIDERSRVFVENSIFSANIRMAQDNLYFGQGYNIHGFAADSPAARSYEFKAANAAMVVTWRNNNIGRLMVVSEPKAFRLVEVELDYAMISYSRQELDWTSQLAETREARRICCCRHFKCLCRDLGLPCTAAALITQFANTESPYIFAEPGDVWIDICLSTSNRTYVLARRPKEKTKFVGTAYRRPVHHFYEFGTWGYYTNNLKGVRMPGFTIEPPDAEICGEYDLVFAAALVYHKAVHIAEVLFRRLVAGTMQIYSSSLPLLLTDDGGSRMTSTSRNNTDPTDSSIFSAKICMAENSTFFGRGYMIHGFAADSSAARSHLHRPSNAAMVVTPSDNNIGRLMVVSEPRAFRLIGYERGPMPLSLQYQPADTEQARHICRRRHFAWLCRDLGLPCAAAARITQFVTPAPYFFAEPGDVWIDIRLSTRRYRTYVLARPRKKLGNDA